MVSLATMGIAFNEINNLTAKDILKVKKRYYLNLPNRQPLRISSSLYLEFARYMIKSKGRFQPDTKVFQQINTNGSSLTGFPMCASDTLNLIGYYATIAKVLNKISIY